MSSEMGFISEEIIKRLTSQVDCRVEFTVQIGAGK